MASEVQGAHMIAPRNEGPTGDNGQCQVASTGWHSEGPSVF